MYDMNKIRTTHHLKECLFLNFRHSKCAIKLEKSVNRVFRLKQKYYTNSRFLQFVTDPRLPCNLVSRRQCTMEFGGFPNDENRNSMRIVKEMICRAAVKWRLKKSHMNQCVTDLTRIPLIEFHSYRRSTLVCAKFVNLRSMKFTEVCRKRTSQQ